MSAEQSGTRFEAAGSDDGTALEHLRALQGARVQRFVLLERLGAGSMGELYTAFDARLDRKIALKLVRLGRRNPKADGRLLREAQALAKLSHPNVVAVYEVGTDEDRVYVAMEYVQGKNLAQWLREAVAPDEPTRVRRLLAHFREAGRGLAAVHAAGFAHRDFKPENVVVGSDGRVRLVDFGLARSLLDAADSQVAMSQQDVGLPELEFVTATDTLLGTPRFMAPEQWQLGRGDARSDQFAFSVALHHALYGSWPFDGASTAELREAVLAGAPRVPLRKREVPKRLRSVLLRNLAREPEQRSPDMGELLDAIDAALAPTGRRALVIGSTLAMSTLVAIGIVTHDAALPLSPTLATHVETIERELAAERRHGQNLEQLASLPAGSNVAVVDAAFASFAQLPEHAHTVALSLAWREQAARLRARGDAKGELAALGEAHWASPTVEGRREVLIELASALDRGHHHAQLGALLDEIGDTPDTALVPARAREAASRHDFAGALDWLSRAGGSELDPLLRELGRATPSERKVAAISPALTNITPLPGVDLDRDGVDDVLLAPAEGPLEIVAAEPELPRLATLAIMHEQGELRSFRHISRVPARDQSGEPRPFVLATGPSTKALYRVVPIGTGVEAQLVRDSPRVNWALGELFDGEGWQGEEAIGLDVGERRLVGLREGERDFSPTPSLEQLDSHPMAALVEDLDDDGEVELVVGVGGWWAYDVRVLSPREAGAFELEARRKLASMTSMTSYRSASGRRLAVVVVRDSPSPRVFPREAPTGVAPGLHLLDWRGPGHELESIDALPLADALELRAADLDGDGLDELIVQRDPRGLVIVAQSASLDATAIWLDALRLEAVHDLDDDGDDELIVSELDGGRVYVLGSGEGKLPLRPRARDDTPAPVELPEPIVDPWQRADTLARIGLHEQAGAAFIELARLVDGDAAALARRRAAELALRGGQPRVAAELFEGAGDPPSVARAVDLYTEVHELDAAARLAGGLAMRDASWQARAEQLARLAKPANAIHVDFRQLLDRRWSIARPGLVRRTPEGLHIEAIGARDTLLLARPFAWTGDHLALDVELEISRLEWGAMLIFELVALDAGREVMLGRLRVASTGGGGQYVLDLGDDHLAMPGSFGDDRVLASPLLSDDPIDIRMHFDALRSDPRAWVRVSASQAGRPHAELAYTPRPAPESLSARHFELRIRSGTHVWQRGVARLHTLALLGAENEPQPDTAAAASTPSAARQRILLALANGENALALGSIDDAALEPREAAWLRTLALEQLGRFTEATPDIAEALGECDDEQAVARFGYALRVEPDRFGPLLREFCSPERFILTSWEVAWDALFHHPALADIHRTMTTQLAELERFEPRDAEQARATADLLTARARGWFMQGLESAAESDLRRALEVGDAALASEGVDPALRVALQRLVALAHVRLAGILITRKRLDEAASELRRALARDAAPEIIADVAFARDFLVPLRGRPIWSELLAAQRGHAERATRP